MSDSHLRPLRPLEDVHHHRSSPGPINTTTNINTTPRIPVSTDLLPGKRATCSQCRIRKVRCDGRQGICHNCERLRFACSFQQAPGQTPGRYALKPPERRRRMHSCIRCHAKKVKCLGELPRCSTCAKWNRTCTYPKAKKRADDGPEEPHHFEVSAAAAATRAGPVDGGDGGGDGQRSENAYPRPREISMVDDSVDAAPLDFDTSLDLVEDYFQHLYPLPSFAFLHKPTVIQRCRDRTMNEPLRLAICAIVSLHLQRGPAALCRHDLWAQGAEQALLAQIGRPSIFHLQALLLVIRYRIESGAFPTAFMLAALATRTALALRLNYERSDLPPVAQEARRRLFWALYLLDDFFCVGLREFELPEEIIHLQLPCSEEAFEAGQYSPTGLLRLSSSYSLSSSTSLRGLYLRLTSVRRSVMRFNRRVGLGEEPAATTSDSFCLYEAELSSLQASLDPLDQYSVANLVSCKRPAQFIMVHMSWHQCHCDLFRMLLSGYSEAAPSRVLASIHPRDRSTMQRQCLEHAESIIRILSDFMNHGRTDCYLERDAAVCWFESARLVMFGARLPGAASTLDVAIAKAKLSLDAIVRFFPYSASTQPLRKDLESLIQSYSARLVTQTQARQTQNQTQKTEPEPERPGYSSRPSGVSQYATSRQRLSVQSLLLQSDFVDDSHEIAGPAATSVAPSSLAESYAPVSGRTTAASAGTGSNEKPGYLSPSRTLRPRPPHPPSALPPPANEHTIAPTIPSAAAAPGSSYTGLSSVFPGSISSLSSPSQQHQHQHQQQTQMMIPSGGGGDDIPIAPTTTTTMSMIGIGGSSTSSALDAGREDAGLIFNPWMGFTGTEDLLTSHLDGDY
ncbi:hypothetical protein F4778DRAFT_751070 [Xylariomycetidae sp. FL2044]|nr:hypothetical protein F4778DRAFT_751070 [Xylariomycetidae sp. FL2044]